MEPHTASQVSPARLVFIADRTFKSTDEADIEGNELEMISNEYFEDLYSVLKDNFSGVTHYHSPKELVDNIAGHSNDIVLTIYGGSISRNRMALIPSICEAYNTKFVGADAYARILCQDKFLTKEFANRFGIASPYGLLLECKSDLEQIRSLQLPLIIKPNFEGSSIGISEDSKVTSYEDAYSLAYDLLNKFDQPILVEEFQAGKEVCICIIGLPNEVILFEVMEVYCPDDEGFLHDRVYSAYEKHLSSKLYAHRSITNELKSDERDKLIRLFASLGKMDFIRIDGRVHNGKFYLIELTPDAYLGKTSAFNDAAKINGLTYNQLIAKIVNTSLNGYHTPYSSCTES